MGEATHDQLLTLADPAGCPYGGVGNLDRGLVMDRWPALFPASQVTTSPDLTLGRLPMEQAAGRPFRS
jgi:hypothetical protein